MPAENINTYNPTTWSEGDLITAEKLNKIEQGISLIDKSSLIITPYNWSESRDAQSGSVYITDKTFGEIYQAFHKGCSVILIDDSYLFENNYIFVIEYEIKCNEDGYYYGEIHFFDSSDIFKTDPVQLLDDLGDLYLYFEEQK